MGKAGIRTIYTTPNKLSRHLQREKDPIPQLDTAGVYEIPCTCGLVYVGETARTVTLRRTEHIRQCRLSQPEKSAVAEHSMDTGHAINFDGTKVLVREHRRRHRLIREAIEIARRPNKNFNRDTGAPLYDGWRHLITPMGEEPPDNPT